MVLKEMLAATAALVLVGGFGQVAAQQSATPAQPATAQQDSAVGEMEPAAAQVDEPAEPALSPAEFAAEAKRCKENRRKALNKCLAMDQECRAAAMRRNQKCLASLRGQ